MLSLALGRRVRFCPREEFVKIETKISCHGSSGIADILDNGVFHIWGLVSSSGVQTTGM